MADSDPQLPEFYSTVPISTPTVVPDAEDVQMNGFAWSVQFGLMLAYGDQDAKYALDQLDRLRTPLDAVNVNDQGLGVDG